MSREAQKVLCDLEALRFPVVTAINGNCLGGGLELALATTYRVAADDSYQIGLPEVQLGVIPGAGGTQRLPRLIGLTAALEMILAGKRVRPARALKLGIVDEIVPPELTVTSLSESTWARRSAWWPMPTSAGRAS